jgi:hypothetical protein
MKTLTTGMLFLVLVYYHIMEVNAEYQNICIKFKADTTCIETLSHNIK